MSKKAKLLLRALTQQIGQRKSAVNTFKATRKNFQNKAVVKNARLAVFDKKGVQESLDRKLFSKGMQHNGIPKEVAEQVAKFSKEGNKAIKAGKKNRKKLGILIMKNKQKSKPRFIRVRGRIIPIRPKKKR